MLTRAQFRARFPEFRGVVDSLVDAKLGDAALRTSDQLYGARADEAHGWLTAHLLASSPYGFQARLKPNASGDFTTVYSDALKRMAAEAGAGGGLI